jgi:Cu-processing system ATP-binding protein
MSAVLEIRELTRSYGEIVAVDGLSLEVRAGEVVALLGPNGSGKTTTIRCIAGLLNPDRGTILVKGYDLRRQYRQARRQFTYLPQQAEFPGSLSVREVLQFHARLRRLGREAMARALAEAGIGSEVEGRAVSQLSGGMRQRVSLAVACLPQPPVMLLDEPTANLDPAAALNFRRLARSWRSAGRALLLSTHVLTDVVELADRVIVLVDGKLVASEDIAQLRRRLDRYATLRIDVGKPTELHRKAALSGGAVDAKLNATALLVTAPQERRLAILHQLEKVGIVNYFETVKPSIEDLYLEYVKGPSHED